MTALTEDSIQHRVVEFFTLRDAAREIASIPEETRGSVFRELRVAFQQREAAETLWPRGSTAEALKLAVASLEGLKGALAAYPEPRPDWVARAEATTVEATKALGDAPLPVLENEVEPRHEAVFRSLVDSLLAIEAIAGKRLSAPAELHQIRIARIAATAIGTLLFLALAVHWFRKPPFSTATASGQHSPEESADKAIDGDTQTGWALPDHIGQGWLDLELERARPIHIVRVLPINPPYYDRGTKDVRIDALLDGAVVKSIETTFPEQSGKGQNWSEVVLDAPKCNHLRFTVKSNYRVSAAINEVELK